jgi:spermidine synthase
MDQRRRLFVLLYAASGAAALVYEVTWTRLLTLQLGHTVAAASTVLAAFMGGLALGAWVAGKRRGSTLRSYVVLELVVAVSALLLPIALGAAVPALAWAYADGSAPARFAVVRVAISLALLGIPAAAMGATFPIAADWYARNAADAGALYAVNTAGAAAGAIAAGFFLIPALGLRGTTWTGVLLNLIAASGAWWLVSRPEETAESAKTADVSSSKSKKDKRGSAPSLRSPRSPRFLPIVSPTPVLACAAAGLSGFSALIYEVAWTRLLALVIGPTTYAFATMAAAFISGLAIGSAVGTRIARRVERPAVWLSAIAGAAVKMMMSPAGLPALSPAISAIAVIVQMADYTDGVRLSLLKDHDNPNVAKLTLALDPSTMLLVKK